jgi:ribosomal protein S18 acetylase RimI-like enzyme
MNDVRIRTEVSTRDRERVRELTAATGMFHPPEVDVAVELVDDRLAKGTTSDYLFLFADVDLTTLGYACYGRDAMTESSWELYWIAVDPRTQGSGIGRRLLELVERDARARGATQLFVETAGRPIYAPTRAFYLATGYTLVAELPDYYAPGDSKCVFAKRLGPP